MAYYSATTNDFLTPPITNGQPPLVPTFQPFTSGVGFGSGTGERISTPRSITTLPQPVQSVPQETLGSLVNPPGALFDRNTGRPLNQPQTTPTPPMTPPTPGSADAAAVSAGMYGGYLTPAEQTQQAQLETDRLASATQIIDPAQAYKDTLAQYQAQIDALNSIYADRLNQSRIQGQGRIESRQFAQGRAGQIGSGTGEAGINAVQTANTAIENSIRAEQAAAIADVYAKVKTGAADLVAQKTKAKQESATALLAHLNDLPNVRAKNVATTVAALIARGVQEMTPEEQDSFSKGLNVPFSTIQAEWDKQMELKAKDIAKAENEAMKALPSMAQEYEYAKKEGYTGTFSQYQNEDANRKAVATRVAKDPSITEKKATALSELASVLVPGNTIAGSNGIPFIDQNGFLTPEGFKVAISSAQKEGISRKEFLAEYGDLLFPQSLSSYGITAKEIKDITGALPEAQ